MTKQTKAIKLALEALENTTPTGFNMERDKQFFAAITALREALAEQPAQQEPVAVKHMMEWVDYLKRKSDYGQHMKIPSEMSAGACWELAIELEQFINTTPPQRTWVGLTDDEKLHIEIMGGKSDVMLAEMVEAKLKEKNTP